MASGHLHLLSSVDVWQQSQAKALRVGGVCEAVDGEGGLGGMKGLPHTIVQFIICNRAPVGWVHIRHRVGIWNNTLQNSEDFYITCSSTFRGNNTIQNSEESYITWNSTFVGNNTMQTSEDFKILNIQPCELTFSYVNWKIFCSTRKSNLLRVTLPQYCVKNGI